MRRERAYAFTGTPMGTVDMHGSRQDSEHPATGLEPGDTRRFSRHGDESGAWAASREETAAIGLAAGFRG